MSRIGHMCFLLRCYSAGSWHLDNDFVADNGKINWLGDFGVNCVFVFGKALWDDGSLLNAWGENELI
jgi:hypothetical protein